MEQYVINGNFEFFAIQFTGNVEEIKSCFPDSYFDVEYDQNNKIEKICIWIDMKMKSISVKKSDFILKIYNPMTEEITYNVMDEKQFKKYFILDEPDYMI